MNMGLEFARGRRFGGVNADTKLCGLALVAVFPPKGGTRVLPPPPPPFLAWFPLMWSLECFICIDLMEKLYLPPSFLFLLGGNTDLL